MVLVTIFNPKPGITRIIPNIPGFEAGILRVGACTTTVHLNRVVEGEVAPRYRDYLGICEIISREPT